MPQAVLTNQVTELSPSFGLNDEQRRSVAEVLSSCLADTYRLFIFTQGLHWNVQGPLFYSIHKLTESQYRDLFEAIDEIAERVRMLGLPAPQSVADLTQSSDLEEPDSNADLLSQIESLIAANETVAMRLRAAAKRAEEAGDVKSVDLLTNRVGAHEENVWMLRATAAS